VKSAGSFEELITTDRIFSLHKEAVKKFGGGGTGPGNSGCVEGALGAAWSAELYDDHPDKIVGLSFAGHLLFYLVKDHCFSDGNKRVGWLAAVVVLGDLGLSVGSSEDDAHGLVDRIATGAIRSGGDVVSWLADRLELA
jgi:death-on-curing protein